MGAKGQRQRLRLFLEGIEVPVIAIQVQTSPNAPMTATLQIPPHALATKFYPRTLVHAFFLDTFALANPLVSYAGGSSGDPLKQNPTTYQQSISRQNQGVGQEESDSSYVQDTTNINYKLIFTGEVVGFQWTKDQNSRSIVLQCVDLSNYWDYAYQFNNTDIFGPGVKAAFSGGSTNLLTDFLTSPAEVVTALLHQSSIQYPALKGLLGGIVRVLEAIGGSYYYDKTITGQNIFFSLAELRLHISQMITAYDKDKTGENLLNADGWSSLFGRLLGGLGDQVSMRDVINSINSTIFHETYAQSCPMYVPGSAGSVGGLGRQQIKNVPSMQLYYTTAANADATCQQLKQDLVAPAASTTPANNWGTSSSVPTSTATPAATLSQQSASQDASSLRSSVLLRMSTMVQGLQTAGTAAQRAGFTDLYGPFQAAATAIKQAVTKTTQNWVPGLGPSTSTSAITSLLDTAVTQLQKVENYEINTVKHGKAIPARLQSHILRPDIWFGPPPRCNVFFPENYGSVSYTRMFLQEPTRFLLKTNNEFFGEDELFDQYYMSPKVRTVKGQKSTLAALFSGDILTHEVFTGVLPVFEKMGEFNIFAVRSGTTDGTIPKVGLAQRSANFLYFKHRFASRQMTVQGKFNPYVAAGFPGLVIDKYIDVKSVQHIQALMQQNGQPTPDLKKMMGTHFLGNFSQITHNLDQRSGTTSITATYGRQHDEISDFLGPAIQDDQNYKKQTGTSTRNTIVAALSAPPVGSIGPNFGKITSVVDVTVAYGGSPAGTPSSSLSSAQATGLQASATQFPLFNGPRSPNTGNIAVKVPVNLPVDIATLDPFVQALVGQNTGTVLFHAYQVTESVPQYTQVSTPIPPEEYIRPGWYGDVWSPPLIGATYQFFLNIGSIVDPTQITNPDGSSVGNAVQGANYSDSQISDASKGTFGESAQREALTQLILDSKATIEQAVNYLVMQYSYVKQSGADVDAFVSAYTWRPIATMVDLFGSADLVINADSGAVTQGVEGFHSRAFGPYNNIFNLVTPQIQSILGINRQSASAGTTDVRGPRFAAVADYIGALTFSTGLLG